MKNTTNRTSIKSPLTGGKATLIGKIALQPIIEYYKGFDTSRYFKDLDAISIYECSDTTYRFYYPYTIAGDGPFYEFLSSLTNLYYIPWKWEHAQAAEHIGKGDRVLELGCANGNFLERIRDEREAIVAGTEINEAAAAQARGRGIEMYTGPLPEIAKKHAGNFDLVCSFQVLEHISDVKAFIEGSLTLLKSGGRLIIGVPNNGSFIKETRGAILNMPPHHMGLWTQGSLANLPNHFNMETVSIKAEPLQKHHYRYYYQVKFGDAIGWLGLIGKILNKIIFELIAKHIIARKAHNIDGHTVLAVFKKR